MSIENSDDNLSLESSSTNVRANSIVLGPNQSMVMYGDLQIQGTADFKIYTNSVMLNI